MGECSSIRARDQEEKHFTFVVSSIHKTGFGNTILVCTTTGYYDWEWHCVNLSSAQNLKLTQ